VSHDVFDIEIDQNRIKGIDIGAFAGRSRKVSTTASIRQSAAYENGEWHYWLPKQRLQSMLAPRKVSNRFPAPGGIGIAAVHLNEVSVRGDMRPCHRVSSCCGKSVAVAMNETAIRFCRFGCAQLLLFLQRQPLHSPATGQNSGLFAVIIIHGCVCPTFFP
jgi:hypothetical protein